MHRQLARGSLGVVLAALALSAAAQDGDPNAGRVAAETCMGCHGVETYQNAYPAYHVPKIGGQSAAYIASALKAYRDGSRTHPTMHANAENLSDETIADIAAFLAAQGQ